MTAIVVPRFRCGDDYRKSESPLGKPEGSISIRMFMVLGQQHEHTTTAGNPQVKRADFGPCRFDDRSRFKCQMIFARMAGTARSVFITASVEPSWIRSGYGSLKTNTGKSPEQRF